MTWQQCGAKRYYYRNGWREGRSIRTYVGTGTVGELAATADALQRVKREIQARHWRYEQERRAAARFLLDELCEQSDLLFRATLVVAGYRQHQRGAWRRTRVKAIPDSAHRRYLAALKTLTTLRKLMTPARSPVEIARKFSGERSGLRLRQAPVEVGIPVEN